MPLLTNTQLELIQYGQQGWNTTIQENAVKLNTILEKFAPLWNLASQVEGSVLTWDNVLQKWIASPPAIPTSLELTDGATINIDASGKNIFYVTLGGNRTFANPTNLVNGKKYTFFIIQDGTGSRTLTWGTAYKFPDGDKILSTAPDAVDQIKAIYVNDTLFCNFVNSRINI